jgi:hypothetical protein
LGKNQFSVESDPMTSVVESLPAEMRSLFAEVIGGRDVALLSSLRTHPEPELTERLAVEDILSAEFTTCLQADDEPTRRGREIDNLLGAFLLRWPIDLEKGDPPSG